jgi:hypothetical protein
MNKPNKLLSRINICISSKGRNQISVDKFHYIIFIKKHSKLGINGSNSTTTNNHLNSIQIESKHGYQYLMVHTRLSQFDTKLNPIDTISSAYRLCT